MLQIWSRLIDEIVDLEVERFWIKIVDVAHHEKFYHTHYNEKWKIIFKHLWLPIKIERRPKEQTPIRNNDFRHKVVIEKSFR